MHPGMLCPQRPDRWLWDGLIGFYGFLQLTAGKLRSSEKQYTLLITHPWPQLQSLLNDSKKGTQSIEKIDNQRIKKKSDLKLPIATLRNSHDQMENRTSFGKDMESSNLGRTPYFSFRVKVCILLYCFLFVSYFFFCFWKLKGQTWRNSSIKWRVNLLWSPRVTQALEDKIRSVCSEPCWIT